MARKRRNGQSPGSKPGGPVRVGAFAHPVEVILPFSWGPRGGGHPAMRLLELLSEVRQLLSEFNDLGTKRRRFVLKIRQAAFLGKSPGSRECRHGRLDGYVPREQVGITLLFHSRLARQLGDQRIRDLAASALSDASVSSRVANSCIRPVRPRISPGV